MPRSAPSPLRVCDVLFTAIDFEGAGAERGRTDEPVQIGMACMDGWEVDSCRLFRSFLRPDAPVSWAARRVHGISDDDVAGAPGLLELWPIIKRQLEGRWIVSHGASTEQRYLRVFPLHGFGPWVDTLRLVRAAMPEVPSHSLGEVARMLGVEAQCRSLLPDFRWHDALSDAVASLLVVKRLAELLDILDAPAECLLKPGQSGYFACRRRSFPTR